MSWASKERNWNELIAAIQSEVDANNSIIPEERVNDIEHYLESGEYSMAFEYLYLEIMERHGSVFHLGVDKAREIALFFGLDDENECMVDHEFWDKFSKWSGQFTNA